MSKGFIKLADGEKTLEGKSSAPEARAQRPGSTWRSSRKTSSGFRVGVPGGSAT